MNTDDKLRKCHQETVKKHVREMEHERLTSAERQNFDLRVITIVSMDDKNSTEENTTMSTEFRNMVTFNAFFFEISHKTFQVCKSMNSFVDCMLQNDYWELCPEAMQAEVKLLNALPPTCDVTFVPPKPGKEKRGNVEGQFVQITPNPLVISAATVDARKATNTMKRANIVQVKALFVRFTFGTFQCFTLRRHRRVLGNAA